jgi:hypothetical protein
MTPYSIDFACSLCQDANERNLEGLPAVGQPRTLSGSQNPLEFLGEDASTSNVVAAPKAFGTDSRKTAAGDGDSYISYLKMP